MRTFVRSNRLRCAWLWGCLSALSYSATSQAADTPPRFESGPELRADADTPADASAALRVSIDAAGVVTEVEILEGVNPRVDARILEAAYQMHFAPAQHDGRPVPSRIRFRFRLMPAPVAEPPVQPPPVTPRTPRTPRTPPTRRPGTPPRGDDEIVVRGRRQPGAATQMSFRVEELTTVPGTFGEPTRIVATQPGVARTPFGLGYFIVRGASFENTGFFIDGFPVLIMYHLAAGPSIISSRLVGQLDFYPGGYPVQFGRFSAGVISLETRPPPTNRPRVEAEIDFLRASALGVLPFDHGRGSVAIALRRSYYDFVLPVLAPGVIVNYADGQIRLDYALSNRLRTSFFLFGSSDTFDRTEVTGNGASTGQARDGLRYDFYRLIAKLEYNGPDGFNAGLSSMAGSDHTGIITTDPGRPNRGINLDGTVLGQRLWVKIPGKTFSVHMGIDAIGYIYNATASFAQSAGFSTVPPPQANGQVIPFSVGLTQFGIAGYIEAVLRTGRFEFTAGGRAEYIKYFDNAHLVGDPRVVARLKVHDRVSLVASTGLFHQAPPFFSLIPGLGNPDLLPQRSWQTSVSVEANLPFNIETRLTGFFNRMWNLPRPTFEYVDGPNGPMRTRALSDGEGRSYGMEVLIRRKVEKGLYGWLSYTLSRSERFIGSGAVVPFTFDQTHILNLAASWAINDQWRVGGRFQLATGTPTEQVTGAIFDADTDSFRPQQVPEGDRLPTYHQLDLRVDYLFRLGPLRMNAYLDVLNVYYAQTAEDWVYQYNYKDRRPRPGLPILPTLGIRGEL